MCTKLSDGKGGIDRYPLHLKGTHGNKLQLGGHENWREPDYGGGSEQESFRGDGY
ncbi:MAG: hypothetical protein ACLTC4_09965 [Hungatella hathewayi]